LFEAQATSLSHCPIDHSPRGTARNGSVSTLNFELNCLTQILTNESPTGPTYCHPAKWHVPTEHPTPLGGLKGTSSMRTLDLEAATAGQE
jgi:hypothetical protein